MSPFILDEPAGGKGIRQGRRMIPLNGNVDTLEAEEVTVSFDGVKALEQIRLSLRKGEILGLIGPNGAGKTTLVNVLSGFQTPNVGRVLFKGADIKGWKAHALSRKGVVRTFQAGRLFKNLTVLENVQVPAISTGMRRAEAAARAAEIIEWIGHGGRREELAGVLPYADERRVAIARCLVMNPDFILLDEPAAGMSNAECDSLMRLISEIDGRCGAGVLLIEHNMRVVMGICSRIQVLEFGRTIAIGSPAEIQQNAAVRAAYLGLRDDR